MADDPQSPVRSPPLAPSPRGALEPLLVRRKPVPTEPMMMMDPGPPPAATVSLLRTNCEKERPPRIASWIRLHTAWTAEIASFGLAVVVLVAAAVTVAGYQHKPQPNWPSYITLNSVLAIFSAVLKAALIFPIAEGISEVKWVWFARPRPASDLDRFDAASRGPWGSLLILLQRPGVFQRSGSLLVSLGATITILALAIDPFTQQVLRYYSCLIPAPTDTASIPRTNNFTAAGGHTGAGTNKLDLAVSLSMYEGLINPPANESSSISFDCPSGNCTFVETGGTAYHSLAICSQVKDISHLISSNDSNHFLQSGIAISNYNGGTLLSTYADFSQHPADELVFGFQALMLLSHCNGSNLCSFKPWAFSARLYPCVNSYTGVQISQNILQETIANSTPMVGQMWYDSGNFYFSLAGNYPSSPGVDCTPSSKESRKKTVPTKIYPDGRIYSVAYPGSNTTLDDAKWYAPECTYELGYATVNSLRLAPTDFFGESEGSITYNQGQYEGKIWLQHLYSDANTTMKSATTYVEGLARAMTATMRQGGDPSNSKPASGVTMAGATCVSVDWAWLALPAALTLLTSFFLCATIIQSRHVRGRNEPRQPWKSSLLPLLFCGLPDAIQDHYGSVDAVKQMRENGSFLNLRLHRARDVERQSVASWGGERSARWVLA